MREILQKSENTPKSNFLAKPNNIQLRNRRATPIVKQDLRFLVPSSEEPSHFSYACQLLSSYRQVLVSVLRLRIDSSTARKSERTIDR